MSRTVRQDGKPRQHFYRKARSLSITNVISGIPLPGELSLTRGGRGSKARGARGFVPTNAPKRIH